MRRDERSGRVRLATFTLALAAALTQAGLRHAVAATISFTADRDTTIYFAPDAIDPSVNTAETSSNGSGVGFAAGRTGTNNSRYCRALIHFDLSSIPAGSTINQVTLRLYAYDWPKSNGPASVNIWLSLGPQQSWGQAGSSAAANQGTSAQNGDATWKYSVYNGNLAQAVQWTTAGVLGAPGLAGTGTSSAVGKTAGTVDWASDEIKARVQQWVDSPATNYGWILMGDESQAYTYRSFASSESTSYAKPTLIVSFVPEPAPWVLGLSGALALAGFGLASRRTRRALR